MITIDGIKIKEYPYDNFTKIATRKSVYSTFDIETSLLYDDRWEYPQAVMYIWQWCIGTPEKRQVYIGRTWAAFRDFINDLADAYRLGGRYRLMPVYVHNLPYEFQWLRSVGVISDMFALKKRVPVRFTFNDCFSFRCSYKLSNMSLAKFCKQENAAHGKRTGYDYSKIRYSDMPLDDDEMLYCIDDVLGLHESIASIMKHEDDTLTSIPYTSTGYVRREARSAVQKNKENRKQFEKMQLCTDDYFLCKAAARGGNTHACYNYAGRILDDITSHDKASSYPHQMVTKLFPVSAWMDDRAREMVQGAANLAHIVMYDVILKLGVTIPYIAHGKCLHKGGVIDDNGRVLKADFLEMVITDIDFDIIQKQYNYSSIDWISHKVAEYGYLSREFRDLIKHMFEQKCKLKKSDPYFYAKYKNKINAMFGMMLTDITRPEIIYFDGEWREAFKECSDALLEYYHNKKSFLNYQQGLFVTANARRALQVAIDAVGADAIYCDTDSVKHFEAHTQTFDELNAIILADNVNAGWPPVVVDGKEYSCGVWELDEEYKRFITYGAKKYAYEYAHPDQHGGKKYGITVAGLNKEKGAAVLEKEGLEAFHPDKIFTQAEAGRLTAHYNDDIQLIETEHGGHKIELTSNVALIPTMYTLDITSAYADLLNNGWEGGITI